MKIELAQGQSVSKRHVAQIAETLSFESFGHGHGRLLPFMREALQRNIQRGAGVYLQVTNNGVYDYDPNLLIRAVGRRFSDPSSVYRLKDEVWHLGATSVIRQSLDSPIATYPHDKGVLVVYPQNR